MGTLPYASEYLAKARTNSLKLAEWKGRGANNPEVMRCPLCKAPKEDLEHFMIECQPLQQTRDREIFSKIPNEIGTTKEKTIFILFKLKTHWKETAEMIQSMWLRRKQIMETHT